MKLIILLLLPTLAFSQLTKGIIKDSTTGKPIPYANIWVENEDISAMADSIGQYAIRTTSAGKTLIFSAAGYKAKKAKLMEIRGLMLAPATAIEIREKSLGTKTVKFGDYNVDRGDLTFGSHGKPWMLARKFRLPSKLSDTPFLKEITLFADCHNNNMKLSLRFFEVGADGNPGRELTDKLAIFRVDRGRDDVTVDLTPYNIKFPENGLFVAVSWMIISQNVKVWYDKRPMQWKEYDPGIAALPSEESSTWSYAAGKWEEMGRTPHDYAMKPYRDKFVELAMKLTLSN
ncbi:MAG: hypothetical protein EOO48_07460 [Flavobacterium sp.]|nr:MAG: hypothetical protein EOO48_07460 [Flavobacterium sp.]